jgi:hypothetical protein
VSRPLDIQIVTRAREIISDRNRWCRGAMCRGVDGKPTDVDTGDAVSYCFAGAIERAAYEMGLDIAGQMDALWRITCHVHPDVAEDGLEVIFDINDARDGHAAVLALFDKYIAGART